MRYGPLSYFSPGRVFPRDRQREPFKPLNLRARREDVLFPAPSPPPPPPPASGSFYLIFNGPRGANGLVFTRTR